jgi:hypothetical protein
MRDKKLKKARIAEKALESWKKYVFQAHTA